jgi:hypothetical protein
MSLPDYRSAAWRSQASRKKIARISSMTSLPAKQEFAGNDIDYWNKHQDCA